MRLKRDLIAYVGGLAAGTFVLVRFGFVELLRTTVQYTDLAGFWAGPRALLNGVDPYDPAMWQAAVAGLGTQPTSDPVYGYPPWMLVALVPLALLPLAEATLLWTGAGLAVAIVGIWVLLRTAAAGTPLLHWLVGASLLGSLPAIITFYSGQWSFFLVGASSLLLALWLRGRHVAAMMLAGAFLVKPHLVVFAAIGFARAALALDRRRALALAGAVTVAPVLAVTLVRPDWVAMWLRHIPAGRATTARSATLQTALSDLLGPAGVAVAVAIVLLSVAIAWRWQPRGDAALAVWPAISVSAPIYGWSYDHVLLTVPLIVAVGVAARRSAWRARALALSGYALLIVGELVLYQFAAPRGTQSLNALVPAAVTALILAALWPQRDEVGRPLS